MQKAWVWREMVCEKGTWVFWALLKFKKLMNEIESEDEIMLLAADPVNNEIGLVEYGQAVAPYY